MDFIKQQNNTFPENYSKTSIKHKSNKLKYTFLFAQRFETGHKLNKKRKQKYPISSLFKFQKPDSLLNLDTRTPRTRLFKIQISIPIVSNLVTGSCSSPPRHRFRFPRDNCKSVSRKIPTGAAAAAAARKLFAVSNR